MLKVFKGKEPSPADVDSERARLETQRQDIRTRQQALEMALADAYGTDTDTTDLEREYAALEAKLAALAIVERRLNAARAEAVKRAALAVYRAEVEAIAADWQALQTITPKREKAGRAYFDLLTEENRIRERLRLAALGDRRDDLRRALVAAGLNPADIAGEVEALDSTISDATGAIVRYVNVDGSYK